MVGQNINSGYGQTTQSVPFTGAGQIFVVAKSAAAGRKILEDIFKPFDGVVRYHSTIDAAVSACVANRGDVVYVAPGHTETVASAGAIALDVAGVSVIGLGNGADKPTLTFSATASTVAMSGASTKLMNFRIVPGIDAVVSPLAITGADCEFDIEVVEINDAIECERAVLATNASRLKGKLKYDGRTGGNACVNGIRLVGGTDIELDVDFYGKASTAVVEFHTTAVANATVTGYMYNSGTTNFSKSVVDTVTGSTWYASFADGAAGQAVNGGSGEALAPGDLSSIATAVAGIATDIGDPSVRTNLKTIEAMLGNPDQPGASIYDKLNTQSGTQVVISKTLTSSDILTGGVDITTTVAGKFLVKDIFLNTDPTGLAGGTNLKIENTNANGVTLVFEETVAALGANATESLATGSVASQAGTTIENGAKLVAKATGVDCTGAGKVTIDIVLQRVMGDDVIAPAA